MGKKLLTSDPAIGKKTFLTEDTDGLGIQSEQEVSPIIDFAKEQESAYRPNSLIGNTQRHQQKIAEIPLALYFDLLNKFGQPKNNPKAWKKWLSDPDNKYFRTTGGNL